MAASTSTSSANVGTTTTTTTTTTTASSTTISLSQITALVLVYRRLLLLWCVGPFLAVALPLAIRLAVMVLNTATAGYAAMTLLLLLMLGMTARHVIYQYSPSNKAIQTSVQACWRKLPYAVVLCGAVARWVIRPMSQRLGGDDDDVLAGPVVTLHSQHALVPSIAQSLWIMVTGALLGVAVVTRFVWVKSIVRCSTVPLASNPFSTSLREFFTNPASLLRPTDAMPGELSFMAWNNNNNNPQGRRFQRPTWSVTAAQAMLALLFGAFIATVMDWLVVVGDHHHQHSVVDDSDSNNIEQFILWTACIFTLLLPLLSFTGLSHELDPKAYYLSNETIRQRAAAVAWGATGRSILVVVSSCLFALLFSIATAAAAAGASEQDSPWWTWQGCLTWLWQHHPSLRLCVACWAINLYHSLLDRAITTCLFWPRPHLRALVTELDYDGTPGPYIQVVVHSLVHNHAGLAREIWNLSTMLGVVPPGINVDDTEMRRSMDMGRQLAQHMLYDSEFSQQHAPLEEDVLQIAVLGSLQKPAWSQGQRDLLLGQYAKHLPPPVSPVVRTLVVLVRAYVEALHVCCPHHHHYHAAAAPGMGFSQPMMAAVGSPAARRATTTTWILPPGLLCAAEWAVQAMSRCIVESIGNASSMTTTAAAAPMRDWKYSPVNVLIPTSLEAILALRNSVTAWLESYRARRPPQTTANQEGQQAADSLEDASIADEHPGLVALLRVCDASACAILQHCTSPVPLQPQTSAWANDIMAAHRQEEANHLLAVHNGGKKFA